MMVLSAPTFILCCIVPRRTAIEVLPNSRALQCDVISLSSTRFYNVNCVRQVAPKLDPDQGNVEFVAPFVVRRARFSQSQIMDVIQKTPPSHLEEAALIPRLADVLRGES